jgi:hypothetical protein
MKVQIALYLVGSLLNYALVEGWLTGVIDRALWRHSRRYRRLAIRRSLVGWRLDYHGSRFDRPRRSLLEGTRSVTEKDDD